MNKLQEIFWKASQQARQKRATLFRQTFKLNETTRILDIGSEDGTNINLVLTGTKIKSKNVFIADIEKNILSYGQEKFGYQTVLLDESGRLPFADKEFDLIYCSSVIEHATVPKEKVWEIVSDEEFQRVAWKKQKLLTSEIKRVGQQYFVQTPARYFPIESHTWLPLVSFLPRSALIKMMRIANRYWVKQAIPDFKLLDARQMKELFSEAEIILENKFGLVKSIIAIKKQD